MSKHIQAKQREAKERGDTARDRAQAYAHGAAGMSPMEWHERHEIMRAAIRSKRAATRRTNTSRRSVSGGRSVGQRVTETEANRQAREPQAVANGELRPDWKARETGRTSTRFQREQELARSRGFRTAHEMRKANHRSKARYVPPADEQPEPMDRFAQVPGPVRWIMRDGRPVHQPSNER